MAILLSLVLTLACVFTAVGCGKKDGDQSSPDSSSSSFVEVKPEAVTRDLSATFDANARSVTVADVVESNGDLSAIIAKIGYDIKLGDIIKGIFGDTFSFDYYSDGNWYFVVNTGATGTDGSEETVLTVKFAALPNALYNCEPLSGKPVLTEAQLKLFGKEKFVNAILLPLSIKPEALTATLPAEMLALVQPLLDMTVADFNDLCQGDITYLVMAYGNMDVDALLDGYAMICAMSGGSDPAAQTSVLYAKLLKDLHKGKLNSVEIDETTEISVIVDDVIAIVKVQYTQYVGAEGVEKFDEVAAFIKTKVSGTITAPVFEANLKAADFFTSILDKIKELFTAADKPDGTDEGGVTGEPEVDAAKLAAIKQLINTFFGDAAAADMGEYILNKQISEVVAFVTDYVVIENPQLEGVMTGLKTFVNGLISGTIAAPVVPEEIKIKVFLDFATCLLDNLAQPESETYGIINNYLSLAKILYSDSTIASIAGDVANTTEEALLNALETVLRNDGATDEDVAEMRAMLGGIFDGTISNLDPAFLEKTLEEIDSEYYGFIFTDENLAVLLPLKNFKVKDVKSLFDGSEKNADLMKELEKISFVDFVDAITYLFGGGANA